MYSILFQAKNPNGRAIRPAQLLQVVDEAQNSLHIVSFAVYKAATIAQSLVAAAQRAVDISIYLETAETSEHKLAFDTVKALGRETANWVTIYVWPSEKRLRSPDNRIGSLHAKLALADGRTLLISSANLTEYAMTVNMELGVLIHGGATPAQVEAHLRALVEKGIFEKLNK